MRKNLSQIPSKSVFASAIPKSQNPKPLKFTIVASSHPPEPTVLYLSLPFLDRYAKLFSRASIGSDLDHNLGLRVWVDDCLEPRQVMAMIKRFVVVGCWADSVPWFSVPLPVVSATGTHTGSFHKHSFTIQEIDRGSSERSRNTMAL